MTGKGFVIATILYLAWRQVKAQSVQDLNALKEKLMNGYNKNTNPSNYSDFVNVTAVFLIEAISDLDEQLEKLTTTLTVNLQWRDESMVWDELENGIYGIYMDKEEVWVPYLFIQNRHHSISFDMEERRYFPVVYSATGDAFYSETITAETTCDLDTSDFPFDQHTCVIRLRVNKYSVRVKGTLKEFMLHFFEPDGSWDVTNGSIAEEGSSYLISLTLARKPEFILLNLIIPMLMLALLSPLVFLLPNQSGERVGFSITVLLATSVFMTIVSDHVPHKSKPFPRIITLLFISYTLTVGVVMVVIINARIYRLPDRVRIPRPLMWLYKFNRVICCCFRRRNIRLETVINDENEALDESKPARKRFVEANDVEWKDISWAIDMCFMILLFTSKIALIVVFLIKLKSPQS